VLLARFRATCLMVALAGAGLTLGIGVSEILTRPTAKAQEVSLIDHQQTTTIAVNSSRLTRLEEDVRDINATHKTLTWLLLGQFLAILGSTTTQIFQRRRG